MINQFWSDVIDAYGLVSTGHDRSVTIERDGKSALVSYGAESDSVVIFIVSKKTETVEPLPTP